MLGLDHKLDLENKHNEEFMKQFVLSKHLGAILLTYQK